MKKLLIILIILLIPLISSVNFEMKTELNQGETLLAKVSGNFLDQITEDNIFFYKEHVRTPFVYDVGKINDDFYIYALLTGKEQGNYSVKIKDVRYMSGIEIKDDDIVKNFTITENTADFSLNPGFVITSDDFFFEVQNLQDQKITIQIDAPDAFISKESLELKSGETKKINFELNTEDEIFDEIKLSSNNTEYRAVVFVNLPNITEEEEEGLDFKFEPGIVDVSMATNSDSKRIIYILNTGDIDAENISLSVSPLLEPYVNISPEVIDNLEKDSNEKIEINIISDSNPVVLEGIITATAGNFSASMTLILNFIEDYIPEEQGNGDGEIATTCAQLEGVICKDEEKCTGETTPTKDGLCCLAQCEKIKKSSTGKIIGWSVVVVVILLLFWFFKKYKKVRPKVDLLKIGKSKK